MNADVQLLPIASMRPRVRMPSARTGEWLLLLSLLLCWSSSFIGIRFTVDFAPITLVAFWRNLIAGVVLLPFAVLLGPRLRLRQVAIQGLYGIFAMAGLILGCGVAIEQGVPTGIVALMSDMLPLAIVLLSIPMIGQVVGRGEWVGIGLAVCGILVASAGSFHVGAAPGWAYSLPLLGMISIAVVTLLQKRLPSTILPIHQSLCIQSLSSAGLFLALSFVDGRVLPPAEPAFWAGIAWLVLFATIGGYGLYYFALKRLSSTRVGNILYLSPPATMLWGRIMFGEPFSMGMVVGLAITLTGVMIASRHGGEHPV